MDKSIDTDFKAGDIIRVYTKDPRASKVHATPFEGVVISVRGGKGNKTFTIRKVATGQIAVERIFPLNSPIIEKIQLVKKGSATRAKLFFLRAKHAAKSGS